jgi:hypothetical protein
VSVSTCVLSEAASELCVATSFSKWLMYSVCQQRCT